jgi:hypothetical protein
MKLKTFLNLLLIIGLVFVSLDTSQAQRKSKKKVKEKIEAVSTKAEIPTDTPSKYAQTVTQEDLSRHLHIIASDSMEGRNTGELGQKKAANYIREHFKSLGLKPPVDTKNGKSYYQEYQMLSRKWDKVSLKVNGKEYPFMEEMFVAYNSSQNQEMTLPFVWGGSDAPNTLQNQNLKGKGVLISVDEFNGRTIKTTTNQLREMGAEAIIVVLGTSPETFKEALELNARYLKRGYSGLSSSDKKDEVAYFISGQTAKNIFGAEYSSAAAGKELSIKVSLQASMIEKVEYTAENVLGFLEGTDKKDEILIITAHYDHIGMQGEEINNGADDDGSGTVAVLELAEAFAKAKVDGKGPRRSILFMTVSGEEKGLLGSQYYTDYEPIFPLENTVADLNIDMIGRIGGTYLKDNDPNYIYLIGSDKLSTELHELSEAANQKYVNIKLDYTYNDENDPNRFYYRSDHYNFAKNNIPIIFYFNGTHPDYHRPTDTVDKIHFPKMEKISRLVFYTAWEIANRENRLIVDKAKE